MDTRATVAPGDFPLASGMTIPSKATWTPITRLLQPITQ
jgi:hypothetical protein